MTTPVQSMNMMTFAQSMELVGTQDQFLNNQAAYLQRYYHKEQLLQMTANGFTQTAPYKVLYRYQPGTEAYATWGNVFLNGEFERAPELEDFRTAAIAQFTALKKINGNQAAPRVNQIVAVDSPDLSPTIMMGCGNAFYHDQVGTNLVIDWDAFEKYNDKGYKTLRAYNQKMSRTPEGYLPSLDRSLLANTLGVTVGIIAPLTDEKDAPYVTILRMRGQNVSLNGGTWSPALSFAAKTPNVDDTYEGTLKDFLNVDLNEEARQEVGLSADELTIKPLAIAQELGRGGKPELFLVAESKVSLTEINARLTTPEMKRQKQEAIGDFTVQENAQQITKAAYAPQSVALSILVHDRYNQKLV